MDTSRFIDFDEVTLRKLILEKNKYNNYPRIVYTETVFFFFNLCKEFFQSVKIRISALLHLSFPPFLGTLLHESELIRHRNSYERAKVVAHPS